MRRASPTLPVLFTLAVAVGGCNQPGAGERSVVVAPMATTRPVAPAIEVPAPVAAAGAGAGAVPAFADPRQLIPLLASDELAGRLPGTPGLARAADLLAGDLARLGLRPLPPLGSDFQPFTMRLSTTLDPATGLAVDGRPLVVGRDYDPVGVSGGGPFRGGVVFAGYGITRPGYDDYAGADVAGRVALAMMKEPLDPARHASRFAPAGRAWSDDARLIAKAAAAAAHGAVALLLVSPPAAGGPDDVRPFFPDGGNAAATIPVVQVSRRVADLLLTTANQPDLQTLQDRIDDTAEPASVPLADLNVSGEVVVKRTTADTRNVVAALPGVGPHADEWVVVGAHYDHLGRGQLGHRFGPVGSVYPGADDNASGTAAVVELAARLKAAGPLPRSVLFALFSGEEEGLVGSAYFVQHPPVPLDHVVAMLNMDMVGRLRGGQLQVGGDATAAAFDPMLAAAVAGTGLHTVPCPFGRGGLGPSDHQSFAAVRVPVLFLFTGLHADYHRPTDTADKINYPGLDQVVTIAQRLVDGMAAMPRQTYDASADGTSPSTRPAAGRVVLGVVPDFSAADAGGPSGVPISGVGPNTPAARAGLRGGDRLVSLGVHDLTTLDDLSAALAAARPGDAVAVRLLRDGRSLTVQATLTERNP